MRCETMRRGALGVLLLLVLPGSVRGQADSLVGSRVVARGGARLRTDDGRSVDANLGHPIYRVDQVTEGWVRLVAEGRGGWARPHDVIPLDRALDYYTDVLREHPDAAWALVMRGLLYEELQEPAIALADYNEALRVDPDDALAHLRRGMIRASFKHDPDRALADFTAALRLDPKRAQAFAQRGHAYRLKREFDRAIADYTEALRLDPRDTLSYHGRALAWQAKGDYDRALRDYDEVIRLAPEDPVALLNRGNLWCARREYDRAIADYTAAIMLNEAYVLAYNNRGTAWREKREYDKALADHNAALRIDPRDPTAYLNRGIVWKRLGEFDRALADYQEALRLDPRCAEAYNGRAWVQATCADPRYRDGKAAYEAAARACALTGWAVANHLDTLAAACAESRDFTRAVRCEARALALADGNQKDAFRARLQLYEANKPYRDAPATPAALPSGNR